MRSRFAFWTGPAVVGVAVAATAVVAVRGQDPGAAKYYPPAVSPAPSGIASSPTRGQPTTLSSSANPNVQYGSHPARPANQPQNQFQPQGKPRITQPVMAGPDGVVPVGYESGSPLPPPPLKLPPKPEPTTAPTLPPPSVTVETQPDGKSDAKPSPKALPITPPPVMEVAPPPIPEPKPTPIPFVPPTPVAPPTGQIFPPSPTTPQPAPTAVVPPTPAPLSFPTVSVGTPLPSKQTPNVTVEVLAPESVSVGSPVTLEFVVRNAGSTAVHNVRVEGELPARSTLVGTEPAAETAGERLAWPVGTLDAGAEKRVKATVKVADEGEIRSRATVTFATAVDARVKVTRPRVTLAVTGPESARVGDPVAFQIKLTNSGTGPAAKVQLRAEFTGGLTHAAGSVIEAELANLPAGQTKTLTLETVAAKSGPQGCTFTATADATPPETAKAAVNLVEPLLVVKQNGPAKCLVRGEPVYAVELSNPGTAATDSLNVWAAIPDGFEFVSATEGGTANGKTIGWKLPGLQPNTNRVVTMKLRATGPAEGVVKTMAQSVPPEVPASGIVQTGLKPGSAAKPLAAQAETAVKAEGVPALRFEVSDLEDPVEIGKEAVYEVRVANQGTGPCTNVVVVADLPEGSSALGATGPTTGRASGQQIAFDPIPTLGVKGDAVFRVRVKGTLPGDQRFKVRVSCDQIRTPVTKEESTRFYKD